ncbi:MAG TPA: xanthine dehydrogenase family protein molybdopterin-binding subunit [Stellaceae bacterium]|nr:xanthine dehydrogenase family protein molybdopterin-binding subunit [Stellaceae bacterium]
MSKFGVGQSVPRTEDPRFLTGRGCYVDDIVLPLTAHGYVLRSPHAHARLKRIDTAAASAAPGVLAVLTGADAAADKLGGIPVVVTPVAWGGPPGHQPLHPVLVRDRVRHVGDPVAFIVAETAHAARDAAELVEVDYEALPAVAATADAAAPGAPLVWDEAPDNVAYALERGDKGATDRAFAGAAHVTRLDLVNNRLSANAMEPRVALGAYEAWSGRFTLHTSSQGPHKLRPLLARAIFRKPDRDFRIICPDVGGGFGMKGGVYPEDVLVLWAARRLGRPVKWVGERAESLMSDTHGRDAVSEAELALDKDGKFLGLRVRTDHALGAYLSFSSAVPAALGSLAYVNVYDIPAVHVGVRGVFTHTTWTGPYRGAGKPESVYVTERLIDRAAREMSLDPAELRRRNFIAAERLPCKTPLNLVYDSGSFGAVLEKALAVADWQGFAARRARSEQAGKRRGIGLGYFIEIAAPFNDRMEIRFDDAGAVTVLAGTHSHGQGHETVYAQMVSDWLGVPFDSIRVLQGDTDLVGYGRGTYGSRSMTIGGSGLKQAADLVIEKARAMAAHLLETAAVDLVFADGKFTVAGTDRAIALTDIAKRAYAPVGWPAQFGIGLEAVGGFTPTAPNFPNGCHVCELEIDVETGKVAICRYTAVDDSGVIINPLLFEGQIHGGIAMGIGQALLENVAYDAAGQLLSATFLDYGMPRADDMPSFHLDELGTACKTNPLGVKGAGESGTVGAPPAVINAILDALAPLGVRDIAMPATPERIWQAIHAASAQRSSAAASAVAKQPREPLGAD